MVETFDTERTLLTLTTKLDVKCPSEAIVPLFPALNEFLLLSWQSDSIPSISTSFVMKLGEMSLTNVNLTTFLVRINSNP